MGFRLAEEAYRNGEVWRHDLLKYLRANRDLAISEIKNMEGLKPYSPEATYLLWIDANALSVKDPHFSLRNVVSDYQMGVILVPLGFSD